MLQEITALKLRHHLGEILDQVANHHDRFLVKRSGIPAAVILSLADFEELQDLSDTWQEQQDSAFQKSLRDARAQIDAGESVTIDDLRCDLVTKEKGKRKPSKR
jgi:prevent-host-death family protein